MHWILKRMVKGLCKIAIINSDARLSKNPTLHNGSTVNHQNHKAELSAQWKQEMKAEETGSARRMLCQYFMHSRWKDTGEVYFILFHIFVTVLWWYWFVLI